MKIESKFLTGENDSIVEFKLVFVNESNSIKIKESISIRIYELELRKDESYFLLASNYVPGRIEYFLCSTLNEATELMLYALRDFSCEFADRNSKWTTRISVDNNEFKSDLMKLKELLIDDFGFEVILDIEENPFVNCYLFDTTLSDWDEVYDFIVELNSIYVQLSEEEKKKDIYLNYDYGNKCIVASYEKSYYVFPQSINHLLGFQYDPEFEDEFGEHEDEDEQSYNVLGPCADELIRKSEIQKSEISILDSDLPF